MKIVILHHSVVGETRDLANRFKYPSMNFAHYRGGAEKIVIIGRHIYKFDDSDKLERFIKYHKKNIIGVIISDDKNFGHYFGDVEDFYKGMGVKVLAIWDRVVTDKQIEEMEELIDGKFR